MNNNYDDILELLHNKDAEFGSIGNAMNAAQTFIHSIQKVCKAIQITGRLRLLEPADHYILEVIAATKLYKNVLGEQTADLEHSQVHQFLLANPKKFNNLVYEDGKYFFIFKDYNFIVHHVWNVNELTVAQILNTGPANFIVWLRNALPWGWTINDYQLIDNDKMLVKNLSSEKAFFQSIGFNYILPSDRVNENRDYWMGFKV